MALTALDKEAILESAGYGSGGMDPDIVTLSNGNIAVTWTERLSGPGDVSSDTDGAVFMRVLTPGGVPVSDIIQVNDVDEGRQNAPEITAVTGGFVVGYTSRFVYGETTTDRDTFITYFRNDGTPIPGFSYDILEDTPTPNTSTDQVLHEMITLSEDRLAVLTEDQLYLFANGGNQAFPVVGDVDDLAQLRNGNIVTATAIDGVSVELNLFSTRFGAPEGVPGVYEPLSFLVRTSDPSNSDLRIGSGNAELAALGNGGFALAYVEGTVDEDASVLRIVTFSETAVIEGRGGSTTRAFEFSSNKGAFDMIALADGGLAMAMTRVSGTDGSFDIEVVLFDEDGRVISRVPVSAETQDDQANPSLTQLDDGRLVVAYTDASDTDNAGASNPMRLAYFEVEDMKGRFVGTIGEDRLLGLGGNDRLSGLDGDDVIKGRSGDDRLLGGAGTDKLVGGNGSDALRGGNDDDTLQGGGGADGLGGGEGRDRLSGGSGNDVLGGGIGNDRLAGNKGDDVLKGGRGDDTLIGGGGNDLFVFDTMSGSDTVKDFDAGADSLRLQLDGLERADVSVSRGGGDTVIAFGSAEITLEDVTLMRGEIDFQFL